MKNQSVQLTAPLVKRLTVLWPWIMHSSSTYGVDPFLIAAVAWKESDFNVNAVNFESNYYAKYCKNLSTSRIKQMNPAVTSASAERRLLAMAWGPMQVVGLTARERGYRKPHLSGLCGEDGIRMGTVYLAYQLGRYGDDIMKSLSAYNAGSVIQSNHETYVVPALARYSWLKAELHDNPAFGEGKGA
jgi:soluble lytic murein transglycosylase-like protein